MVKCDPPFYRKSNPLPSNPPRNLYFHSTQGYTHCKYTRFLDLILRVISSIGTQKVKKLKRKVQEKYRQGSRNKLLTCSAHRAKRGSCKAADTCCCVCLHHLRLDGMTFLVQIEGRSCECRAQMNGRLAHGNQCIPGCNCCV